VRTFFPYLELFHYFGLNVPAFVIDNPFGTIKSFVEYDIKSRCSKNAPWSVTPIFVEIG
jgi:hypothetical protein